MGHDRSYRKTRRRRDDGQAGRGWRINGKDAIGRFIDSRAQ